MKPIMSEAGNEFVRLSFGRSVYNRNIGNLILRAFAGPPPAGHICCHGPRGRQCHDIGNLCWGTSKKNLGEDKNRDGTMQRGKRNGRCLLSEDDVLEIRRLIADGNMTQPQIAERFGVSRYTICDIKRGKNWSWMTGQNFTN